MRTVTRRRRVVDTLSAITTGFGYTATPITLSFGMGIIAIRRVLGFPRYFDGVLRFAAALIPASFGIRVRVRRSPRIPRDHPMIVLSNHVNIFDGFVLQGHLPVALRGIELEDHFRWPVYGIAMRLYGNIPLPHGAPSIAMKRLLRAVETLGNNDSILAFPEGHRTRDGQIGRFGSGAFRVAVAAADAWAAGIGPAVPVLPVFVAGAFERQHVGTIRITPGTVEIRVGEPIYPDTIREIGQRGLRTTIQGFMEKHGSSSKDALIAATDTIHRVPDRC